jgi:hypothetical protein
MLNYRPLFTGFVVGRLQRSVNDGMVVQAAQVTCLKFVYAKQLVLLLCCV